MTEIINIPESKLIPVYEILGCTPSEVSLYSLEYIRYKIKDYYANIA